MPQPIDPAEWSSIRTHFRRSFSTNLHVAIATSKADGSPDVTPIGSLILNRDGTGFFFELFTAGIPKNARTNTRVCIMSVNSGLGFWVKSLLSGRFSIPPMIKLYGELGERRAATQQELDRFRRCAGILRFTPGGKKLWRNLHFIREVRFDGYERARAGEMTR